jgi:hypothetical protein
MKIKTLLLNGKPLELNPPRPSALKLVKFLDTKPGEIFTGAELEKVSGVGVCAIARFHQEKIAEAYCHRPQRGFFYGNPEAIKEFKRLLAEQGR